MTLREYFEREADACLTRLAALDPSSDGGAARDELYRAARELRGAAQLAREPAVQRAARALENALRPDGAAALPDTAVAALLDEAVAELSALVRGGLDEAEAAERADALVARWAAWAPAAANGQGTAGTTHAGAGAAEAAREFTAFAAREVRAIAAALEAAVTALARDPLGREPIEATLRRQRALLGAARLSEVPIVEETLRAVEDLSQVINRLGVGVKGEWLDVFRSSRDVLTAAAGALYAGTQPQPSHALSRLRTLRQELLDRYGSVEPAPPVDDVVDVALLCYDRDAALRRALELRPRVQRAIGDDADANDAVDEVFDLLRIALG